MTGRAFVAAAFALPALACVPHPHKPAASATVAAQPDAWAESSWEDRHATMTFTVLPNMARLWQEHDHSPAPDLTCLSCHGKNAEAIDYRMPNTLPALDPAHMPRVDSRDAHEAAMTRFMTDQVVPTMRELTGSAKLSCFSCHPHANTKAIAAPARRP